MFSTTSSVFAPRGPGWEGTESGVTTASGWPTRPADGLHGQRHRVVGGDDQRSADGIHPHGVAVAQ
jgi:hypothetical protein